MSAGRRFSGDFKAKVALEALRGDKTIQEIATGHKIHPNQRSRHRAAQSRLELGYNVHPRPARLPVPGGGHGLGYPPGALLAALQHPRYPLLHRSPHRSPGTLRPPRDLQHRPRQPVHSLEFTSVLKDSGIAISMDGRGAVPGHIFIERLWRSLKYEAVYLHELSDGFQAQRLISRWFAFYDRGRPHSALAGSTPAEAYENRMLLESQAEPHSSPAPLPAQTGTARRVKPDSGGMTHQSGIHLNSAAHLSYKPGPPE